MAPQTPEAIASPLTYSTARPRPQAEPLPLFSNPFMLPL